MCCSFTIETKAHEKNPEKAIEYYEKTVKYAIPESKYFASNAFLHLALVYSLKMDYQKAYEYSTKAKKLSPSMWFAYYEHARYCAKLGKENEVFDNLKTAFDYDIFFLLKAINEPDFINLKSDLSELTRIRKNMWEKRAKSEVYKLTQLLNDISSFDIDYHDPKSESSFADIERAELLIKRDSIIDYFEAWNLIVLPYIKLQWVLYYKLKGKNEEIKKKLQLKINEQNNLSFFDKKINPKRGEQIANEIFVCNEQIKKIGMLQEKIETNKFQFKDKDELKNWICKNKVIQNYRKYLIKNQDVITSQYNRQKNSPDLDLDNPLKNEEVDSIRLYFDLSDEELFKYLNINYVKGYEDVFCPF